jgi:hypothetical protein
MKAKDYLKLDRTADRVLDALDDYLAGICGGRYDWNQINIFDIPLISSPRHHGHKINVSLNLPGRKVKYWLDGDNVQTDSYHGYDDNEMAAAIANWNGWNFVGEFDFFI